jgi:type I restriction enzyme S subunit
MFLPDEDFTAIKNTITLTPIEGVSYGTFLYHLFDSIDLPKRGAGQPFISKGDIQSFEVKLPTLQEQQQIVTKLDAIQVQIGELRTLTQRKIELATSLRSSILSSAFAGDF